MRLLVTGGTGFIGSHTCIELLRKDHEVMIIDNLSNSSLSILDRLQLITNKKPEFSRGDVRNTDFVSSIFSKFKPDAVLHFAGLKSVSESTKKAVQYYNVNVGGTIEILKAMEKNNCGTIVFSSSATVYGEPVYLPYDEVHPTKPINPYGWSKLMAERVLEDWVESGSSKQAICLRYFNPVGADASGILGESPSDIPNNLMPVISRVASGEGEKIFIFGDDYDTRDGTGERDYIHVSDLAFGHLLALTKRNELRKFQVINLGTGKGVTVKELISEYEKACNKRLNVQVTERRPGDIARSIADVQLSGSLLGFQCKHSISNSCEDAWRWEKSKYFS